ncbi:M48 family metalloprotease [Amorphus orientalis]|uniref:Zn-dependent protease n=1 Tax=Amorphus orientalis TaxID=649198 RepID=A0AAE3VN91_9HYPH|nr:M48 family metalloprotease [Amorphus orientalis]MDQ0314781.1 putative Zn-dependent protease [Amorphus orientalis]
MTTDLVQHGSAARTGARSRTMLRLVGGALAATASLQLALAPLPAAAQGRNLSIVRDAETEQLLRDYAAPIFRTAGIASANPEIILNNDDSFNAFVADPRRMFVNTGVIARSETPNEVIGVLAHETGHLAGGHLIRLRDALARAQVMAALATIAGVGAMAAGAATGNSQMGGAGAAAIGGGMGAAQRSLLSYQRGEEIAADRAALTYLRNTQQSARGLLSTLQDSADQQLFSARYADPYALSHPIARDRIAQLEEQAKKSPYWDAKDPPALQHRHDMVRAKLMAFTEHPNRVLRAYPTSDNSQPAQYARAIVAYRTGKPRQAQQVIDSLIRTEPGNPYFWELKGQAWLEAGRPREAIGPLQKAVEMAPRPGLMRIMLGQALVGANDPSLLPEAIRQLERGVREEPNSGLAYRQLAIAYARSGDTGLADVATARAMMMQGQYMEAKRYAQRAQAKLKHGTPGWLQADDILAYSPPSLR